MISVNDVCFTKNVFVLEVLKGLLKEKFKLQSCDLGYLG